MINKKIELLNECNIRHLIDNEKLYVHVKDTEGYLGTGLNTNDNAKCFCEKVLYLGCNNIRYFEFDDWCDFFTSYDISIDVKFLNLFKNIDLSNKFNIALIDFLKNNKNKFSYVIKDGLICLTLWKVGEYMSFRSLNKNNEMYEKYIINTPFRKTNYIKPEGFIVLLINCFQRYEYIPLFTNTPNKIIEKEFVEKGVDITLYNNTLYYYLPHVLSVLNTCNTYNPLIKNNIIKIEDISKINGGIYFTEDIIFKILKNLNSVLCFDICKRNKIQHNLMKHFEYISIEELNTKEGMFRILKCDNKKYYRDKCVYKYLDRSMKYTEDNDFLFFYDNYYLKSFSYYLSENYIKTKLHERFNRYEDFYSKQKIVNLSNEFNLNINFECEHLNNINTVEENEKLFMNLTGLNDNIRFNKMLSVAYGINNNGEIYILIGNEIAELVDKYVGYYPVKTDIFMIPNNELIRAINFELFLNFLPRLKNDLATKYINELGLNNSYFKLFESYTFPIIESALPNVKFEKQYAIKLNKNNYYYLDLAVPSHKICIECDENGHVNYDKDKEQRRENYLLKSGWKILRYNPQYPETIGSVICELYKSFY